MLSILHRIEDLQVVCFAVIFGLMAMQRAKDRTIRFAWISYLLASVVSVMDVSLHQPFSAVTIDGIFSIISLRYAILAVAMVCFTRHSRYLTWISFAVAGVSACMLIPAFAGDGLHLISGLNYVFLAAQLSLMGVIVLRSREKATRMPRVLLATLFFISVACRVAQALAALSQPSAQLLWWRDQGLFINSTVVGCILPFTIIWMMNARTHHHLAAQSNIDPLTEILNRRGLSEAAEKELARYSRGRQDFAVAIADIDHFKLLNDTYGHACGDDVLRATGALFREILRQTDVVSRSGGEEFMLLLPLTQEVETLPVLERVRSALESRNFKAGETTVRATISIGVTSTRGRANVSLQALHDEADRALYAAKHAGRNRTVRFTDLDDFTSSTKRMQTSESDGVVAMLPTA